MAKEKPTRHSSLHPSPKGFSPLVLESDGFFLTGLHFQKEDEPKRELESLDLPCFEETKKWLDLYFLGRCPDFLPSFCLERLTPFQKDVLEETAQIPYGETRTYGQMSAKLAAKRGVKKISPQAVGQALGQNPICLLIPCHRVLGSNGWMRGYAGGTTNKVALLKLEGSFHPAPLDPSLPRCFWCNPKNKDYILYHDEEWDRPVFGDRHLFENLVLESFQAGLSWECILAKREAFRRAFDNFDWKQIALYDRKKVEMLLKGDGIVRNRNKILATIANAKIFDSIVNEFGSFFAYLKSFTGGRIYHETHRTHSPLSDALSLDLKKRGMSFVGSVTVYSFLQAIGIIDSHEENCFLYRIP